MCVIYVNLVMSLAFSNITDYYELNIDYKTYLLIYYISIFYRHIHFSLHLQKCHSCMLCYVIICSRSSGPDVCVMLLCVCMCVFVCVSLNQAGRQ